MYSVSSNSSVSGPISDYMKNRKKWGKPQAMIWARNPGVVEGSGDFTGVTGPTGQEGLDFIVISDHNRSPISMDMQRIESRSRMVSGNMRSYYTDDKATISTSWTRLPSRAYQVAMQLDSDAKPMMDSSPYSQAPYDVVPPNSEYTADGGAGGVDMLDWYYNTIGPMWVFLAYDRFDNTAGATEQFALNGNYLDRKKMFFSAFNYSVEKRGLYDMWNISVSLEEA